MRSGGSNWRGVAHAHSVRSFDGTCSYAELRELFVGAGLQFVCMTEHIEGLHQADIDAIIADCRTHSDEKFLFIPGIEMDCFTIYFVGLRSVVVDFTTNATIFRSLRAASGMCVMSHPVKARFRYPGWVLSACDGVEVLNTKHDGRLYFRLGSERLLRTLRKLNPTATPLLGMDFHDPSQLNDLHFRLEREGPLTDEFVLQEIVAGRIAFYRGERPMAEIGLLGRNLLRARIGMMDAARFVNRSLSSIGLRPPRSLRKLVSRALEG